MKVLARGAGKEAAAQPPAQRAPLCPLVRGWEEGERERGMGTAKGLEEVGTGTAKERARERGWEEVGMGLGCEQTGWEGGGEAVDAERSDMACRADAPSASRLGQSCLGGTSTTPGKKRAHCGVGCGRAGGRREGC